MTVTPGSTRRRVAPGDKGGAETKDARATGGAASKPDRAAAPVLEPIGESDIHFFREGTHARLYRKLGCHLGEGFARFAVWAPNAASVAVIGDFNDWRAQTHIASPRADGSGVWEVDIPGVTQGQRYKFALRSRTGELMEKAEIGRAHV